MKNLIPTEYWQYNVLDFIRGIADALSRGKSGGAAVELPGLGECLPTRSARSAIALAFQALNLPRGAGIAVPLYCCPVVFKAIKMAGLTARFIDVDPATYCMSVKDLEAKIRDVDAVIAVHMFGNPCDMEAVHRAARGRPVIEDCAQSLGSRIGNRVTGSFGTIAAFSFRSGKYISAGEGGALYTAEPAIRAALAQRIEALPAPGPLGECRHVAATYLRSLLRRRPLYGVLGHALWRTYTKTVDFADQSSIEMTGMFATDGAAIGRRLGALDAAIKQQRANAECYMNAIELDPAMLCREKPGVYYNRYLFPVMFASRQKRDRVAQYLLSRGIDAAKPYTNIAENAAGHFGYTGDCPEAERIADGILVLPNNHALGEKHVERIAKRLSEAWKLTEYGAE